ncbi:MAG TPA: iron-sulfur cluster insertion protein ErpA [Candidatus Sulfotelmatobacter sp.]|nr:iron-sulfur cluster insertion protein ErpA [Candidatus Sulfotelmatobacter sp.]
MSQVDVAESAPPVKVTESAARRIAFLMTQETTPNLKLRLAVSGGGCSGFQYGFSFDDTVNPDDRVFARDGAEIVIDETSLELLGGAEIDFVEDLVGAAFQIRNPNATSSCGCGNSFSIG